MAPLQGNYSEAPLAQPRQKRKVLRAEKKEAGEPRGRDRNSGGSPFQVEGEGAPLHGRGACKRNM